MKALLLAAALALPGCAVFDSPFHPTSAGIATTSDPSFIGYALAAQRALTSPAMHDAICAAGADTKECR